MKFFKKLRRRRRLDRDLEDELAFHLERSGRTRFGNPTLIKETCRELWMFTAIESWWQDVRYAARTLAKSAGVTATAIVALALGIGINTTVFTVISRAFNIDLGVKGIERVVVIDLESRNRNEIGALLPELHDPAVRLKSFDLLAAYRVASMNVSDSNHLPDRYWGAQMTASGFEILSRQPALGRVFNVADEVPGAAPVAVVSNRMWQDRFGKDRSVIGRVLRVNDVPRVVIGVMPPGVMVPEDVDLWLPFDPLAPNPAGIFGRLAPGVRVGAARAEIESLTRALLNKYPDQMPGLVSNVHLMLDDYARYANRPLFIAMLVSVGFVLLIACADVANLLLAKAAARGREISIRIAIGAGRARIIRQLLIESLLLSSLGGFFGWLSALGALHWFDRATAQAGGRPPWMDFSMDATVFVYIAAISVGTGLLFGIAPALRLAKVDVNSSVKDGGNSASGGSHGRRLVNLLVAFEMLLSVVLLAGAGLLIRSAIKVYGASLGVNPENVLTAHINLPEAKYPRMEDQVSFHRELKHRLASLPGVQSVALASAIPVLGYGIAGFSCQMEDGSQAAVRGIVVDADYFRVMQLQPEQGRFFDDAATDQVVVNRAFAAKYWPGQDSIDRRLRLANGWVTITGVIPNIIQGRQFNDQPLIYVPYTATPRREMFVAARTAVPPGTLSEAFRREVQKLDENLPLYDVQTLETRISRQRMETGSLGILFTLFAAVALVLAAVGLYAVIAHAVSQRTREIGLRMALGGSRRDILRLVLAQGMWPVAVGLAVGLPAAFGLTRVLRGSLVGISPGDPLTFGGVIVLLAAIGAFGCAVPAQRAMRVDPVVALRHE